MKRVLLGSMPVGGGHNALRDSFLQVMKDADPNGRTFETVAYTTQDSRVPAFYEFCVHHVPWMQRVIWDLGRTRFGVRASTLINGPLYREVEETVARHKPDVIVSTHFLLSMMFARARHKLGLELTLVNAIPDYGDPTLAFFPEAEDLRADYTICMDVHVLRTLVEKFGAPMARMHLSGFIPRPPFVEVARQLGSTPATRRDTRVRILERLRQTHPALARFDPNKPTLIFLGGSAWTEKTMPVLELIIRDPEFASHVNILVVSGKNESFQQALTARVAKLPSFFVFGFVSPTEMAELIALSDIPVLGSLAPASMHELLELRTGPMMLFHFIPGSEDAHAEWIRGHEVGMYEPDPLRMCELLMEATGFKNPRPEVAMLLNNFPQRARDVRHDHLSRAHALPELVAKLGGVVPIAVPVPQAQPPAPGSNAPAWEPAAKDAGVRVRP